MMVQSLLSRSKRRLLFLPVVSLLLACGGVENDDLVRSAARALCPAGSVDCGNQPPVFDPPGEAAPPPPTPIQDIAASYAGYDINQDGVAEINALTLMSFEPQTMNSGGNGIVLVLVEPRLLQSFAGSRRAGLLARLSTYRADLVAEGFRTRFFLADLYKGTRHQDGRILLALRRFLKHVHGAYPRLRGVTLVGAFPDAALIRRPLVKLVNRKTTFQHGGEMNGDFLDLHPERITPRGDIVLGDLDGKWEGLYHEQRRNLDWVTIMPKTSSFPQAGQVLESEIYSYRAVPWEDFFYIDDAQVSKPIIYPTRPPRIAIRIDSAAQRHPELTPDDRKRPNPIARPEIAVSRINARGQALTPSVDRPDLQGNELISPAGKPMLLIYPGDQEPKITWSFDRVLEQRILIDYFDRNHAFRNGSNAGLPHRTSAIRQAHSGLQSPSSLNAFLRRADASFTTSHAQDNATLYDFTSWLRQPAVLRGISAHAGDRSSQFAEPVGQNIDGIMGGRVWAFRKMKAHGYWWVIPSWQALGTGSSGGHPMRNADYSYYRTLFENGVLSSAGQAFYIHTGCDVNNPPNSELSSHDDESYGRRNNADNILFLANGLAIYSRGKVFYDSPDGFPERIRTRARFGYGWRGHFNHDAAQGSLNPGTSATTKVFASKKAYFWGLRGDWTLKLKY